MNTALSWQDHAVIASYLVAMIALGGYWSRRQKSDDEYFLAGRRMPWFPVGISVIASLLSSLTYLSEPGEVWNSGVTNVLGKMLAIPLEVLIVWFFCIPFMMRFRFTSAYEYLEHRFSRSARRLGVGLFVLMVVLWMGFVVLASSRALQTVSGVPLWMVIGTVGVVATLYTMLGGLKAVIWTDVVQVVLLIGGGLFAIGYVAWQTETWIPQWYAAATQHVQSSEQPKVLPLFTLDPFLRASVVTVALNMLIWHVCTHTANQMTVQRYFSTRDQSAARKSFLTGSLFGVGINLMLVVVGLAMLYFYVGRGLELDGDLNPLVKQDRDLVFPTFATHRLPAGVGGAILAALLAAAMSSIDSGVNSIATVLTVECADGKPLTSSSNGSVSHVKLAKAITLSAGLFITVAAYGLNFLPTEWGIVDAMPRTFNAITAPLGGLFLIGMFLPRVGGRAAVAATLCGLATSLAIGYFKQWAIVLQQLGWLTDVPPSLSFTLVMPGALLVTFLSALLFSLWDRSDAERLAGLTWFTRHQALPDSVA